MEWTLTARFRTQMNRLTKSGPVRLSGSLRSCSLKECKRKLIKQLAVSITSCIRKKVTGSARQRLGTLLGTFARPCICALARFGPWRWCISPEQVSRINQHCAREWYARLFGIRREHSPRLREVRADRRMPLRFCLPPRERLHPRTAGRQFARRWVALPESALRARLLQDCREG